MVVGVGVGECSRQTVSRDKRKNRQTSAIQASVLWLGSSVEGNTQFLFRRSSATEDVKAGHPFTIWAEVELKKIREALVTVDITPLEELRKAKIKKDSMDK